MPKTYTGTIVFSEPGNLGWEVAKATIKILFGVAVEASTIQAFNSPYNTKYTIVLYAVHHRDLLNEVHS